MNEHWEELREKVRDEFRFKREAVREYFHDTLHNLEAKVVAHIHNAEGRGAAAEETLKCRLEAVEGRIQLIEDRLTTHVDTRLEKVESCMHVAETRLDAHAEAIAPGGHDGHLMTHVESRLEKVERDTLPTRVGTGVAPAAAKYPGEGEAWRPTAGGAQG